jgi:probable phosphoglycerate mutase
VGEPVLTVIRHGETEWSRSGQHTSRSDVDLTETGEEQARRIGAALAEVRFDLVLTSPRRRATRTAALAGLVPFDETEDLSEWDYGELEGLTTAQIQERYPGWSIWVGPWPGGESAADVAARADRVIGRLLDRAPRSGPAGDGRIALIGHGHFSRTLAARWVGEDVGAGGWLNLDTGTWSELGWDRGSRVVQHWNVPVPAEA